MNSAWLALACLIGFVLLVVTTCSSPVSKDITLFIMSVSGSDGGVGGKIRAGVLGFCFEGGVNLITGAQRMSQVGRGSSVICSPTNLGYQVVMGRNPSSGTISWSNIETIVDTDLTSAMVFSPLGATVAGLGVIFSLVACAKGTRGTNIAAGIVTGLATVFSWIAFAVNIGISAKVKSEIENAQSLATAGESVQFTWGAATFLPLGAAVTLTGALVWWAVTRSWRVRAVAKVEDEDEHSRGSQEDGVETKGQ